MSNHEIPCPKCGIDTRIQYHHDESACTGPEPEPAKVQSRAHYRCIELKRLRMKRRQFWCRHDVYKSIRWGWTCDKCGKVWK